MSCNAEPFEIAINEDSTATYTAVLKDASGTVIPLASITSLRMTLIELGTGETVNGRENQNILNTNNVTYHSTNGTLTWSIQVADTEIVNPGTPIGDRELHLATITATTATVQMHREILLAVLNMRSVPQEPPE